MNEYRETQTAVEERVIYSDIENLISINIPTIRALWKAVDEGMLDGEGDSDDIYCLNNLIGEQMDQLEAETRKIFEGMRQDFKNQKKDDTRAALSEMLNLAIKNGDHDFAKLWLEKIVEYNSKEMRQAVAPEPNDPKLADETELAEIEEAV